MKQNPTRTRKPTIYLTSKTARQISLYTKMAYGEISWLGRIVRQGELDFLVEEIFLIKQETSLPVTIANDPLSVIVLGCGMALDDEELLRAVAYT